MHRKARAPSQNAWLAVSVRKNGISILALLVAVPALLYTLSFGTPGQYAKSAEGMFASAASMSAAVPANPYNTLAAQLAEKEAQLNEREAAVAAGSVNTAANNLSLGEILGASSFFISIILLILVAMNFYFDAKRGKSLTLPRKYFVDLR